MREHTQAKNHIIVKFVISSSAIVAIYKSTEEHISEIPCKFKVCDKVCSCSNNLIVHIRRHTDGNSYDWNFEKQLINSSHLQR